MSKKGEKNCIQGCVTFGVSGTGEVDCMIDHVRRLFDKCQMNCKAQEVTQLFQRM